MIMTLRNNYQLILLTRRNRSINVQVADALALAFMSNTRC